MRVACVSRIISMPRSITPLVLAAALILALAALPARALERVELQLAGSDAALQGRLRAASLVLALRSGDNPPPADILAAARADYSRLMAALYETGRYSGIVHVFVDGREAAEIPVFEAPSRIGTVSIRVDPGPIFRLHDPVIEPLAPQTSLPPDFTEGGIASAGTIRKAVSAALEGWRNAGHAKARLADQKIVADHANESLQVHVRLDPGPLLRFGRLDLATPSTVRPEAIRRIAGLPANRRYSPAELEKVASRLRRSGAFSAVTLSEAATPRAGDLLDIDLAVADMPRHRIGLGGEISSLEGLSVTGFWLDRNLLGGAERLRLDASISNLTDLGGGRDYRLSARLDVPAALGTDTGAWGKFELDHQNEPAYSLRQAELSAGFTRLISEDLEAELSLAWRRSLTSDSRGAQAYTLASLPGRATLDRRDDRLNPASGHYIGLRLEPFRDLGNRVSGLRAWVDLRQYRKLGAAGRTVLATRLQLGQTIAPKAAPVHPDFRFWSGGPATVRGQPYKSLGAGPGGSNTIGGRAFAGLTLELRHDLSETVGIVGFYDIGRIGADRLTGGAGSWHAGAGIGLRYQTGLGPLRLDIAAPVGPRSGSGIQIYLGIGQAF